MEKRFEATETALPDEIGIRSESIHLPRTSRVYPLDARSLDSVLTKDSVDVTITSPPYFDLKDYGYPEQIGYGQSYEDYLEDLGTVFKKIYDVTKDTGSLWVVIDMFRREGEVIPLPFDFVSRMKTIGWKSREVIIWEKDRTVPWAHKGQVRNSFEYILVFSKTKDYKFHIDRVKSTDSLKKWWIRYPERYNPRGKSPDAIWHFPIPTQGSWGNGYIRHFCPLPEDLITRILTIASDEGDLVLDPFAGSGSVLSRAANMKRNYAGLELNESYIGMFQEYLAATGSGKRSAYLAAKRLGKKQGSFEKLIGDLRILKFGRLLYHSLKAAKYDVIRILTSSNEGPSSERYKLIQATYDVFVHANTDPAAVLNSLSDTTSAPPYSKFGIEPRFRVHLSLPSFLKVIEGRKLFTYTAKNTHSFKGKFSPRDFTKPVNDDVILSEIRVAINESEFAD